MQRYVIHYITFLLSSPSRGEIIKQAKYLSQLADCSCANRIKLPIFKPGMNHAVYEHPENCLSK
jgi:hypothetical protein